MKGSESSSDGLVMLNHAAWESSLLQSLHKMQKTNDNCNIIFTNGGDVSTCAHSTVLSAASPKLNSYLKTCGPLILLEGISSDAIVAMVDFIYSGQMEIPANEVSAVQTLAEYFEISALVEVCTRSIEKAGVGSDHNYSELVWTGPKQEVVEGDACQAGVAVSKISSQTCKQYFAETAHPVKIKDVSDGDGGSIIVCQENDEDKIQLATTASLFCDKCGRSFLLRQDLILHREMHSESEASCCFLCKQEFNQAGELLAHLGTHSMPDPKKTYTCVLCSATADCILELFQHLSQSHPGVSLQGTAAKGVFACHHCRETFKSKLELSWHQPKHHTSLKELRSCENVLCSQPLQPKLHRKHSARKVCATTKQLSRNDTRRSHMHHHRGNCVYCRRGSTQLGHFQSHVKGNQGIATLYKCSVCHEELTGWLDLEKHMQLMLNCVEPHQCDVFGKSFALLSSLVIHEKKHISLDGLHSKKLGLSVEWDHCYSKGTYQTVEKTGLGDCAGEENEAMKEATATALQEVNEAQNNATDSNSQQVTISASGKPETCAALKGGERAEAGACTEADKNGFCDKCGRYYFFPQVLAIHRKTHRDAEPSRCFLCKEEVSQAQDFVAHMETHDKLEPKKAFRCGICHIVASGRPEMSDHLMTAHGGNLTEASLLPKVVYPCCHCGEAFSSKCVLQKHQPGHHATAEERRSCEDDVCRRGTEWLRRVYTCKVCSKQFPGKERFRIHMHHHAGTYQYCCHHCGKGLMRREDYRRHLNRHEGIVASFRCSFCRRELSSRQGLAKHERVMHRHETPYQCETCGRAFKHASSLVSHRRTHTGEKPYACTFCLQRFSDKNHCNIHMRRHTGEMPYSCSVCGQKFRHLNTKKAHMKKCGEPGSSAEPLRVKHLTPEGPAASECKEQAQDHLLVVLSSDSGAGNKMAPAIGSDA